VNKRNIAEEGSTLIDAADMPLAKDEKGDTSFSCGRRRIATRKRKDRSGPLRGKSVLRKWSGGDEERRRRCRLLHRYKRKCENRQIGESTAK